MYIEAITVLIILTFVVCVLTTCYPSLFFFFFNKLISSPGRGAKKANNIMRSDPSLLKMERSNPGKRTSNMIKILRSENS